MKGEGDKPGDLDLDHSSHSSHSSDSDISGGWSDSGSKDSDSDDGDDSKDTDDIGIQTDCDAGIQLPYEEHTRVLMAIQKWEKGHLNARLGTTAPKKRRGRILKPLLTDSRWVIRFAVHGWDLARITPETSS